jgi:hypothetical protein
MPSRPPAVCNEVSAMNLLKLESRCLNLEHVAVVEVWNDGVEVVTPYEVLRLTGADAEKVLRAIDRLAEQTRRRLDHIAVS